MENKIVVLALNERGDIRIIQHVCEEGVGGTGQVKVTSTEKLFFFKDYLLGSFTSIDRHYTVPEQIFGDLCYNPLWLDKVRPEDFRPLGDIFTLDYVVG